MVGPNENEAWSQRCWKIFEKPEMGKELIRRGHTYSKTFLTTKNYCNYAKSKLRVALVIHSSSIHEINTVAYHYLEHVLSPIRDIPNFFPVSTEFAVYQVVKCLAVSNSIISNYSLT